MFEIGQKVKLLDMTLLGRATQPFGNVLAFECVNGNTYSVLVRRSGIKTPKWYSADKWSSDLGSETFRDAIRSNPWDFVAYLAYADFMEENQQPELGAAWRWMGRRQKKPLYVGLPGMSKRWVWLLDYGHHRHSTLGHSIDSPEVKAASIPSIVLLAVSRNVHLPERYAFQTEDQAIEGLAHGLESLLEATR